MKNLRLTIILFSLLTVVTAASAQRLKLNSARLAAEPMTVPMQRTDFNNEICALVKVLFPVEGTEFEGNIVGKPLFKTNEYWVYMTPGTKMLNIKAPGHYPFMVDFRNTDIGSLQSKSIYYLEIESDADRKLQSADENCGFIVLTLNPSTDAAVRIDGQLHPMSDNKVIARLAEGTHTYQIDAAGYERADGEFRIESGANITQTVQLSASKPVVTSQAIDCLSLEYSYQPSMSITEFLSRPLGFIKINTGNLWDIFNVHIVKFSKEAEADGIIKLTRSEPTITAGNYITNSKNECTIKIDGLSLLSSYSCSYNQYKELRGITYNLKSCATIDGKWKEIKNKDAAKIFNKWISQILQSDVGYTEVKPKFADEHGVHLLIDGCKRVLYNSDTKTFIYFNGNQFGIRKSRTVSYLEE